MRGVMRGEEYGGQGESRRRRLLEYEMGSEWGPMYAILGGQEVSLSVEFPCINEREMERGSLRSW